MYVMLIDYCLLFILFSKLYGNLDQSYSIEIEVITNSKSIGHVDVNIIEILKLHKGNKFTIEFNQGNISYIITAVSVILTRTQGL